MLIANIWLTMKDTVGTKKNPIKENHILKPISPYGNSKKMIEESFRDLSKINKDNTTFYTLSFRESNVNSSLPNYEVKRAFKTIGITKRVNFND